MAIIPGIQVSIPRWSPRAQGVLDRMQELLDTRKVYRVSRKEFLARWSRLRKALFLTEDYQRLRDIIRRRCFGLCEACETYPMVHVHHVVPVAYDPMKALDPNNCQGVCRQCHYKIHK